jgi:two-component system, cell cycle sensor histidine kinase and response regulator CckA
MTVKILHSRGYSVLEAASCSEALDLLADRGRPLDLLLTDVIMPGGSGLELFSRICGRVPGVRVLFMSGYADDEVRSHGVFEEGTAFIQKPFSIKALAAKVRKVIDDPCPQ